MSNSDCTPLCEIIADGAEGEIYVYSLTKIQEESERFGEQGRIAARIKTKIHEHPERFFSNAELARAVNVSVKTAENRFKSMYGLTVHQYILDFKIREAISYFELYPDITVKEVAHNLGFFDEYHFSKTFKRIMGKSPREWRRQSEEEKGK